MQPCLSYNHTTSTVLYCVPHLYGGACGHVPPARPSRASRIRGGGQGQQCVQASTPYGIAAAAEGGPKLWAHSTKMDTIGRESMKPISLLKLGPLIQVTAIGQHDTSTSGG